MENQPTAGVELILCLSLYLIGLVVIGYLGKKAQKEKSLSDFYLAGRSFGFAVLFLTLYATQYSGNTFMAFPGKTYRLGIGYIYSVAMMMSIILGYLMFAPRLVPLSRKRDYVTPTDAITDRFPHSGVRVVSALLLCWGLVNYVLAQLIAIGKAVEGMLGPWFVSHGLNGYLIAVVFLAFMMVVYETLGGMRAVAWTDALQGILLLFGLTTVAILSVTEFGGIGDTMRTIREHAPEKFYPPDSAGCRDMLSSIFLLFLGGPMYPHAIQRLYAANSVRTLKKSLATMVFLPLLSTLPVFLLGMVAIAQFPGLTPSESDTVTTLLLARMMEVHPAIHVGVIVVFVAAIAAIMSTADSALLSFSSIFTQDLYRPLLKREPTQLHLYRVGKVFSWITMAILVWVASDPDFTLWKLLELKFEMLIQVLPAFAIGLYSTRLTSGWLLSGMLVGTALSIGLYVGAGMGFLDSAKPWNIHAGMWGLALNSGLCGVGILLNRRND
ncbi:MAG: sodium:solute symporter family protein [Candidatus Omnitrophica bacterium]|nr:sodium:solute symporter family protein [Candidatus Omnitrophota bacterium]